MKRRDRKDMLFAPICLLLVVTLVGLNVAERGINQMLDTRALYIFDTTFDSQGTMQLTVLGLRARLRPAIPVLRFKATPEAITIGTGGQEVSLSMRVYLPGSQNVIRAARTFVSGATQVGFNASRAIWDWWEARQDTSR